MFESSGRRSDDAEKEAEDYTAAAYSPLLAGDSSASTSSIGRSVFEELELLQPLKKPLSNNRPTQPIR
ncbi:MAG: hypothetical protein ABI614_17925 [Planctomycetota bacterium]